MSDIVERLRTYPGIFPGEMREEAATEIERLRARNKRLQSALNEFVAVCDTAPPVKFINEIERVVVFARAALED